MCAFSILSRFKTLTLVTGQFPETRELHLTQVLPQIFYHLFQHTPRIAPRCIFFMLIWSERCTRQLCHPAAPWRRTCNYLRVSDSPGAPKGPKASPVRVLPQIGACAQEPAGLYSANGAVDVRWLSECRQRLWWTCGSFSMTCWGRCTGQVELRVRLSPECSKGSAGCSGSLYRLMTTEQMAINGKLSPATI